MFYSQTIVKRVAVVRPVSNQTRGILINDKTLGDSLFSKGDLMRREAEDATCTATIGRPLPSATTAIVSFVPLPLLVAPPRRPFLAMTNVPSMWHSDKSKPPRSCRSSASACSTFSNTPERTHCWNLRWHVWYGGYLSGKSYHDAPVRSTHSMPFMTSRESFHGLPLPSGRRGRWWMRGEMTTTARLSSPWKYPDLISQSFFQ